MLDLSMDVTIMSLFLDDECFIPIENGHYFMCQK